MRTISYIFIKQPTGELQGTVACRGALCYTGRILLEQYKTKDKVERLISGGPLDMVGFFEEECQDMINPIVNKTASQEQVGRLPYQFKKKAAEFKSLNDFRECIKDHNHFGSVDFFLFENEQWYHSKHTINNLSKLTMHIVDFDDEDNG